MKKLFPPSPIRKQNVGGTPDFHSVLLEWDFASEDATGAAAEPPRFTVRYCENQVSLHTRPTITLSKVGKKVIHMLLILAQPES